MAPNYRGTEPKSLRWPHKNMSTTASLTYYYLGASMPSSTEVTNSIPGGRRYLSTLKGLQDEREHENATKEVEAFLHGGGPRVQEMLFEGQKSSLFCVVTILYL
jgi:hypothetical protein